MRSPRSRTTIVRSTDSRRARNSASDRIGTRRRPASRPSRRRWRLASRRVDPRTLCTPSPSSLVAALRSRGWRTRVTVPGGSSSEAASSPDPRRRRRRRRREVPEAAPSSSVSSPSSLSSESDDSEDSDDSDDASSDAPESSVSSLPSSSVPRPRPRPRRPRRRRRRAPSSSVSSVSSVSSSAADPSASSVAVSSAESSATGSADRRERVRRVGAAFSSGSSAVASGSSDTGSASARRLRLGRVGAWNSGAGGANTGASAAATFGASTTGSGSKCRTSDSGGASGAEASPPGTSAVTTCSAILRSMLDWAPLTSMPRPPSAARTSRLVRPSSLASACTRIFSGSSSRAGTVTGPPGLPAGVSIFDIQLLRPRAPSRKAAAQGHVQFSHRAVRGEQSLSRSSRVRTDLRITPGW